MLRVESSWLGEAVLLSGGCQSDPTTVCSINLRTAGQRWMAKLPLAKAGEARPQLMGLLFHLQSGGELAREDKNSEGNSTRGKWPSASGSDCRGYSLRKEKQKLEDQVRFCSEICSESEQCLIFYSSFCSESELARLHSKFCFY